MYRVNNGSTSQARFSTYSFLMTEEKFITRLALFKHVLLFQTDYNKCTNPQETKAIIG
jgi:hypothetical protein